jgi:hypothetical protein
MTMNAARQSLILPNQFLGRLALLFVAIAAVTTLSSAQATVATWHNDNLRTGSNPLETILTTGNVNSTQFGKLFSQTIDGYMYAQPLYIPNVLIGGVTHNVVFAATMNDSVYAFDADNNTGSNATPLWMVNFTNPAAGITTVSTTDVSCPDTITTQIGILSTPVIDTSSGTIYVVARTKESGKFFQRLHALDITTGAEKFGGPVVITGSVPGTGKGSSKGTLSFNPQIQNQRSALLLQNGQVYIAWGSLCDKFSYHGWLMAYDAAALTQTAVWSTTPNASEGGLWASGFGPAGDASFNTFVPVGNGTFDVNTGGIDYGQAVVKLGPPANQTFPVLDYFEPYNGANLDADDRDIGSAGMVLLPDQVGAPHTHLLAQAAKSGDIYLIDRDSLGTFNSTSNSQIVQYLPAANRGMWASPTYWNNQLYFGASGDLLKAFTLNTSTGLLSTTPTSQTLRGYGYPGTTVSVSSNQNTNGIVWALNNAGYKVGTAAVLHAYDATNLATEFYNSNQKSTRDNAGKAVKFTVPTVANGKVYVGTQSQLSVYGLLSPPQSARKNAGISRGAQASRR